MPNQEEASAALAVTNRSLPVKYECIHVIAVLEKPEVLSLVNKCYGETVSNALLKSNSRSNVSNSFLSIPSRMSPVSFSSAVWVEWLLRKPVCIVSRILLPSRYSVTCEWAIFSSTLERKHSMAIGRKSKTCEVATLFFKGIMRASSKAQERQHCLARSWEASLDTRQ